WICLNPATGKEDGSIYDSTHYVHGEADPCHCYDPCGPSKSCPIVVDAGPPAPDCGAPDAGDGGERSRRELCEQTHTHADARPRGLEDVAARGWVAGRVDRRAQVHGRADEEPRRRDRELQARANARGAVEDRRRERLDVVGEDEPSRVSDATSREPAEVR